MSGDDTILTVDSEIACAVAFRGVRLAFDEEADASRGERRVALELRGASSEERGHHQNFIRTEPYERRVVKGVASRIGGVRPLKRGVLVFNVDALLRSNNARRLIARRASSRARRQRTERRRPGVVVVTLIVLLAAERVPSAATPLRGRRAKSLFQHSARNQRVALSRDRRPA